MMLLEAWCRGDAGRSIEFRYESASGVWLAWLRETGSGCVGSGSGSTMKIAAAQALQSWEASLKGGDRDGA